MVDSSGIHGPQSTALPQPFIGYLLPTSGIQLSWLPDSEATAFSDDTLHKTIFEDT